MRILVLGGTVFLSRAVAEAALAHGHDVVCAARGVSGTVPEGATLVRWDRAEAVPAELTDTEFDAVVDVSRIPSHVRGAVAAFPDAHWTFVSTVNVYADTATVGGTPATLPLLDPVETDEDPSAGPELYGAMKVACENIVRTGTAAALVIRPGLIVGPGDPSGRFTYWPARFAQAAQDGLPVLVPEPVDDPVQLVDVRDLAEWIVTAAEQGTTGDFDAVCPPLPRAELLAQVAEGTGADPELVAVAPEVLAEHEVAQWSGPRSIPFWAGDLVDGGFMTHDVTSSLAAGLTIRPIDQTARDTLVWLQATPDAKVTGLTRAEEQEVLAAVRP
ncbi:NAD-dependent epimerase/dehydratase family protein [Promicromonospora sp. MEB111]|uniref:NAD-dependent epimerase/dehydratase family protein n=1 Tax=Promicromonospora sp. MEB111 TaxID=3040301 RepID=UPI00254B27D0|nr:NAD-dependent epimerase/dehydratase family protein [Promicromonospora sp. MEB111]